eukprot:8715772-Pyramimonas_sp.AAC.1
MGQIWINNTVCPKSPHQVSLRGQMRERWASTQCITYNLARVSVLIGNDGGVLNVAFHRNVSIRPVIVLG